MYKHFRILYVLLFLLCLYSVVPVFATRLPKDFKQYILSVFPEAKVRLDGAVETKSGDLYLPLLPIKKQSGSNGLKVTDFYPDKESPDAFVVNNGWCYLKVWKRMDHHTVIVSSKIPEKIRKQVLSCHFPSDLIVPDKFLLPKSLKSIAGDVPVELIEDSLVDKPITKTSAAEHTTKDFPQIDAVFVTSLASGSILELDENDLKKRVQYPTEGTPSGMTYVNGYIYITDQSKNRILILNPYKKQFAGQIDLLPKSAPKGIATVPNGKILYVTESGSSDVAVVEPGLNKVLLRTKMPPGPSQIAITPRGDYVLVLSPSTGQLVFISTSNQAMAGKLNLGPTPYRIAFNKDGHLAFITLKGAGQVVVVDIAKRHITNKIPTGAGPAGITFSADWNKLFVANARENTINIYNSHDYSLIKTLSLSADIEFPSSLTLMSDGKHILVLSEASDTIQLLNTETLEVDHQSVIGHTSHEALVVP